MGTLCVAESLQERPAAIHPHGFDPEIMFSVFSTVLSI
jgi:hypothetical protein